eukprot:c181_g1_i1.p1 GENE.c181_g1_i1~~c181_g1_i1.p1  ORF type:complete len:451 (-),score=70.97 c181_g1_i1:40-1368(-)
MGLAAERFLEPVDDEFICPICHDVLGQPAALMECQHHFCWDCIKWHFGSNIERCPVCGADSDVSSIQTINRSLNNLLNKQQLHCTYQFSGCDVVTTLDRISTHESACDFAPAWCGNIGCTHFLASTGSIPINRGDLQQHSLECQWRFVKCDLGCDELLQVHKIEQHIISCQFASVECEKGCGVIVKRKDMPSHVTTSCSLFAIPCEVSGCEFMCVRGDSSAWETHERDFAATHTRLINKQLKRTIDELQSTQNNLSVVGNELKCTKRQLTSTQTQLMSLNCFYSMGLSTSNSVVWIVDEFSKKRETIEYYYSDEYTFQSTQPAHRYSFILKLKFSSSGMGVYFILRQGIDVGAQHWPFGHRVSLKIFNHARADRHRIGVLGNDQSDQTYFLSQSPPQEENRKGRGWRLFLKRVELDSKVFLQNDKMAIIATLLNRNEGARNT